MTRVTFGVVQKKAQEAGLVMSRCPEKGFVRLRIRNPKTAAQRETIIAKSVIEASQIIEKVGKK